MHDHDTCQGKTMLEETDASLAMLCIAVSMAVVMAILIAIWVWP